MSADDQATVYSIGLCHCSCCAPEGMSREVVERQVNASHPTGISHGWHVSEEKFRTGQDNPCPCESAPGRVHYLLCC